jgi:hypothetical protein
MQAGGRLPSGEPAVVGEGGPEIFISPINLAQSLPLQFMARQPGHREALSTLICPDTAAKAGP